MRQDPKQPRGPEYAWGETPAGIPPVRWERTAIPLWAQCAPGGGAVLLFARATIECLDIRSGESRWAQSLPGEPADLACDAAGVVLAFGSEVRELDLRTGATRWSQRARGVSSLALGSGALCYSEGERVTCVARKDGHRRWQTRVGEQVSLELHAAPRVLIATSDEQENVRALSLESGQTQWVRAGDDGALVAGPVAGGVLLVSAHQGGLLGLRLADGEELWCFDTHRSFERPAVLLGNRAFVTDGAVYCLDPATGTPAWECRLEDDEEAFFGLTAAGDLLLAETWSGRLLALHPADGAIRWEQRPGQALGLAVSERRVYVRTEPGAAGTPARLVAFDRVSGQPAWELTSTRLVQDVTRVGDTLVVEWKNRVLALEESEAAAGETPAAAR